MTHYYVGQSVWPRLRMLNKGGSGKDMIGGTSPVSHTPDLQGMIDGNVSENVRREVMGWKWRGSEGSLQ